MGSRGWSAAWNHDDPRAEQRVTRILDTVTDVPEYWEWSGTGMFAVDPSNKTYKLGVNYVIGALTR